MKSGLVFFVVLISVCGITFAQAADYYPLKVGNYWTYKDTSHNNGDSQQSTFKKTVEKPETVNGHECFKVGSGDVEKCSSRWTGKDADGNIVEYAFGTEKLILTIWETPHIIIPVNIKQGTTWENRVKGVNEAYPDSILYAVWTYTIASTEETVTVPAGTFENCLKIHTIIGNYEGEIDTILDMYYAKGVGSVMNCGKRANGDEYKYELVEYNIVE